jgi:cytochrome c biogenesis protein
MSAMRGASSATLHKTTIGKAAPAAPSTPKATPASERLMQSLSSVRFGVALLLLLAAACMTGMFVMQVNMEGFDKYYAALTPSQQLLYGALGFFDIYHTWYFNVLLLVLSLNIVLSSIDNLPRAWTFISRPKLAGSPLWLRGQEQHAALTVAGDRVEAVAARVGAACRSLGLRTRVTEDGAALSVFAERGAWNRLGAYAVHAALLVIFAGGFMTARFGHTGQVAFGPGESAAEMAETVFDLGGPRQTSLPLPFSVECTDIRQKLIDKTGPTSPSNTLDWLTTIKIKDPGRGETTAVVRMNAPFDYRGHRFFQSSFVPEGRARSVRLRAAPEQAGAEAQELELMRDGKARLADGTVVKFAAFYSDFVLDGARGASQSDEYRNPAAELQVVKPSGEAAKGFAFTPSAAAAGPAAGRAFGGYQFELVDYEKVGAAHVLSVQRDPGATVVYVGFVLLVVTLAAVFLFSHQRVWAHVEGGAAGTYQITLGGNTNRNRVGFEDRFRRLVKALGASEGEEQNNTRGARMKGDGGEIKS